MSVPTLARPSPSKKRNLESPLSHSQGWERSQTAREGGTASGNQSRRGRKQGRGRAKAEVGRASEGGYWDSGNPAPRAGFQGVKAPLHTPPHLAAPELRHCGYMSPVSLHFPLLPELGVMQARANEKRQGVTVRRTRNRSK